MQPLTRPLRYLVLLAALVPLAFAAFTGHAWEDYFITLRSSRNLVEGHGLVFNPGERVHTFTSPLGVLIPAACTWAVGPDREEAALWLFRLVNAGCLAAGTVLLGRRALALGLGPAGQLLLVGLLVFDAKLVDFSINGMETALLLFFLILLWSELASSEPPRAGMIATAVAGLMWTRPDAFVLGGVLIASRILIREPGPGRPPIPWGPLARGLLLGGLLYAPWFGWAWWYYGTPVPHTVLAKSAFTPTPQWSTLLQLPWQVLTGQSMLLDLFLPAYWNFGGWPPVLVHLAHALSGLAAFAWLVPTLSVTTRRASLALFCGMFYVCSILLFPWYVPPWSALAIIALAFLLGDLHSAAASLGRHTVVRGCQIASVGLVTLQALVLVAVAWQMRIEQQVVETGVRKEIGRWLREHAAAGQTVFLEPLGYIGYYSRLRTHDFPGLSSPEVVAAVRTGARRYAEVIARLAPDWIVLRPSEAARSEFAATRVLDAYEMVRSWDGVPALDQVRLLPGRAWVEGEARFLLFRRRVPPRGRSRPLSRFRPQEPSRSSRSPNRHSPAARRLALLH